MRKPASAKTPHALTWLVESRNKIQLLLLRLHQEPEDEHDGEWQQHVAAAFSLWRAVFLVHEGIDKHIKLVGHARQFLKQMIERNAITFSDDLNWRAWTGAYYLNDARMRLDLPVVNRPKYTRQWRMWEQTFAKLDSLTRKEATLSETSRPTPPSARRRSS